MRTQTYRAVFNGVNEYVDITWDESFTDRRFMLGVTVTDGESVIDAQITTDTDGASRVEPTAPFVGYVDVARIEVLP